MRILWITDRLPLPADTGGKILVHSRIEALVRRGHTVSLACLRDQRDPEQAPEPLRKLCAAVHLFPRSSLPASLVRCGRWPWQTASRYSLALVRAIRSLVDSNKPDVIQVEYAFMAGNVLEVLADASSPPACLTLHDYGEEALKTLSRRFSPVSIPRVVYRVEALRKRQYDRSLLRKQWFQRYFFVSTLDLAQALADSPRTAGRFRLIPIGIDPERYGASFPLPAQLPVGPREKMILFTGSFADESNVDAVRWFVHRVFPRLRPSLEARCVIAGRQASSLSRDLRGPGITILSDVPDIRPWLRRADVCVAPIFAGGGVRVKVLEALAAGRIVLGTPKAFAGTGLVAGIHVLEASDAVGFLEVLAAVLTRPDDFATIREAGREFILREHSADAVGALLEREYEQACSDRGTPARAVR